MLGMERGPGGGWWMLAVVQAWRGVYGMNGRAKSTLPLCRLVVALADFVAACLAIATCLVPLCDPGLLHFKQVHVSSL
jgi:hypothetical protein